MGHQPLQIALERGRDCYHRQPLLDRFQNLNVISHDDVGLAGDKQLQTVDLRATHGNLDVKPATGVEAASQRLIEPAVFRLREPIGQKSDTRAAAIALAASGEHGEPGCHAPAEQRASIDPGGHADCCPPYCLARTPVWLRRIALW